MTTVNLYELAAIRKLRFPSNKGDLLVEQLFDLPLQSKTGFDLDSIAIAISNKLDAAPKRSFVQNNRTKTDENLEIALEIVKDVINRKQIENAARIAENDRKAEREKLMGILADKQDEELRNLTPEQIKARLAELNS